LKIAKAGMANVSARDNRAVFAGGGRHLNETAFQTPTAFRDSAIRRAAQSPHWLMPAIYADMPDYDGGVVCPNTTC
jgi:hypothetical protein